MSYTLSTRMYSIASSVSLSTIQKSSKLIRNDFLDYFVKDLDHTLIRSSPVISFNDHTVAFVNAGMNQFKGVFLDYFKPPVQKAANSQKCIRISGKHNDLNTVGNDSYHHTFFEMLGNWSFGDYFKEEACRYAWDLLTKHYGINKDFLYVTYFGGDEKLELPSDLECRDIWLSIGVEKDKILPFGLQTNFWEMGISGPCGPCTEIHVDHTNRLGNRAMQVNKGFADLTELWNIVFVQYERLPDGTIISLPRHHVDTGMGFERLVALLQGKQSNYDTDLFQPLFRTIQKFAKVPEYKGTFNDKRNELDSGYRILADHSRMITVALADGVVPEQSNKLRKIIRKSIDISEELFKKQGILLELSYAVAESLGDAYPELQTNLKKVQTIIKFEEELYKRLQCTSGKRWETIVKTRPPLKAITEKMAPGLVDGYKYLQHVINDLKTDNILPGNVAFKLYDTYGLSVETITELAEVESLNFDETDFEKQLESQRYRSKIGQESSDVTAMKRTLEILEKNGIPKTDDSFKYEYIFNGNNYEFPKIKSKIVALLINGNLILNKGTEAMNKDISEIIEEHGGKLELDEIGIILDRTLCYSLKGGQISDKGLICTKHLNFNINNVRKFNGYAIHYGKLSSTDVKKLIEELNVEDNCSVSIDPEFRIGAMQHHTATHLLHASVLQIMQAVYLRTSVVLSNSLKCQFNSFGEKVPIDQLRKIEELINNIIKADASCSKKVLNALELLAENSVSLIPGEIYPYKDIKVVEINVPNLISKEACCGTHISKTGELKYFCFTDYSSKGAANFTLKAIVGSLAISAKLAGENMQREVFDLEKKLEAGEITYEMYKSISKEIENEIRNAEKIPIPYLVKEECLMKLKHLSKIANTQTKRIKNADKRVQIISISTGTVIK